MNVLYKNIGISVIILITMFCFPQKANAIDLDSLKAVYEAENPPIIKEGRNRGGGTTTFTVKEQVYIDEELHKATDGYWVIKGIELYKNDKLNFESMFDGVAKIRIDGELKRFKVRDSLEVGILILKERDKITKEFTGNILIDRPYKGVIEAIAARYIYIKNYDPYTAIKLRPRKEPKIVSRSF